MFIDPMNLCYLQGSLEILINKDIGYQTLLVVNATSTGL